jgi:mycothiol system anti-sigma-R factor
MSCGGPHEVPCTEFLAEVYLFLDRECDEVRRTQLAQHLQECPPCDDMFGAEKTLKSLIQRKCSGDRAPDELRRKLRAQIQAASAALSFETIRTTETIVATESEITHTQSTTWRLDTGPRELGL